MSVHGTGCVKRARAENAQNCFLSSLLPTVTGRSLLFLFNAIETNFLRASSTSAFLHSLERRDPYTPAAIVETAACDNHLCEVALATRYRSLRSQGRRW